MANIWEKNKQINFVENLNSGLSYHITIVRQAFKCEIETICGFIKRDQNIFNKGGIISEVILISVRSSNTWMKQMTSAV